MPAVWPLPPAHALARMKSFPPWGGGYGRGLSRQRHEAESRVAIKVLPDVFACDADRLARFQREAKTLASLNQSLSLMGLPL